MNKIQIKALGLLLIALPHAGNALSKTVHSDSALRTFTTAEIQNRNRSGFAQTIGTQFVATEVPNAHVNFAPLPSCNGSVGPTQYLVVTLSDVISYNKFTGQPDGIINTDTDSFLGALFQPGSAIGDTRCTFDRWGQRFIVLGTYIANGSETETSISLAWSDGPIITPETKWTLRIFTSAEIAIPETPASFPDSPNIATDQNAVYINMGIFELSSTPVFGGFYVTSLVIPQSSFVTGNPFVYTPFYGLFNALTPPDFGDPFAPSPNNYDPNPQFGYIVVCHVFGYPFNTISDSFYMYRILNAGSSSPTLFPAPPTVIQPIPATPPITFPAIPNYSGPSLVPHKGNLYGNSIITPGNGVLQNIGFFEGSGIHIRNHQLYLYTTSQVDSTGAPNVTGDRTAILWYQYDLTGDPSGQGSYVETESTIPVLIQSGTIYDPTITTTPIFYWNPAIMTNKNGDLVVTGNFAGVDNYIQAFYVGRKGSDPLGQMGDIIPLTNNTNSYNYGPLYYNSHGLGQRWGDYCGICPDPTNDLDIWLTNQIVVNKDLWGVLATQLTPAS